MTKARDRKNDDIYKCEKNNVHEIFNKSDNFVNIYINIILSMLRRRVDGNETERLYIIFFK